jgi:nicotinamidase-related amidase
LGVGTRTDTPDSLQNIKVGSRRAEFDDRLEVDRKRDIVIDKRMASAFHETNLDSVFNFHRIDTVVVTGGSTSGCVRATVVDSLQRSFRTIVPEECVADKHESPHFANLYDMALKYAAKPVVSAPFGRTLGGGCEIVLHTIPQASAELYMGQVELGVGLIPAAGRHHI